MAAAVAEAPEGRAGAPSVASILGALRGGGAAGRAGVWVLEEDDVELAGMGDNPAAIVAANMAELKAAARAVVANLGSERSRAAAPQALRDVCRMLGACARDVGLDAAATRRLVGGFVLLRLVNPLVVTPELVLEHVDVRPSAAARKNLLLVSRVVQAAANGTAFRTGSPMFPLNDFVRELSAELGLLLTDLAEGAGVCERAIDAAGASIGAVRDAFRGGAYALVDLVVFHQVGYMHWAEMAEALAAQGGEVPPARVAELRAIFDALGPPPLPFRVRVGASGMARAAAAVAAAGEGADEAQGDGMALGATPRSKRTSSRTRLMRSSSSQTLSHSSSLESNNSSSGGMGGHQHARSSGSLSSFASMLGSKSPGKKKVTRPGSLVLSSPPSTASIGMRQKSDNTLPRSAPSSRDPSVLVTRRGSADRAAAASPGLLGGALANAIDTKLLASKNVFYRGKDAKDGAPVFYVILARATPDVLADMNALVVHVFNVVEELLSRPYYVVLDASWAPVNSHFITEMYGHAQKLLPIFTHEHKKNLRQLFIVHPSLFTRNGIFFLRAFVSMKVSKKFREIDHWEELTEWFASKDRISLPKASIDLACHAYRVGKVNSRGKRQERHVKFSSNSLLNIDPKSNTIRDIKRLADIVSVDLSDPASLELVLNFRDPKEETGDESPEALVGMSPRKTKGLVRRAKMQNARDLMVRRYVCDSLVDRNRILFDLFAACFYLESERGALQEYVVQKVNLKTGRTRQRIFLF